MSKIDYEIVARKGGYGIGLLVLEDLSYDYFIMKFDNRGKEITDNANISFNSLKNAKDFLKYITENNLTWKEVEEKYNKRGKSYKMAKNGESGYLPIKYLKKYPLFLEEGEGRYAEKMRKKLGLRVRV